jgi:Zn-dependent alcohol dehydrogenase
MTSSTKPFSRRAFLSGAATLTGGLMLGTRAFGGRRPQANDMLDVAVIGAGGRGTSNIGELLATGAVNIVALGDCDERQAAESFAKLPNAKRYSDWRKLLDAE